MNIRKYGSVLVLALAPLMASADGARDWANVPIDMNFLYVYYTYSSSNTAIDAPIPADGASVSAHVPVLRYARSFGIAGRISAIQLVAPYAFVEAKLDGTPVKRSTDGLGDITGIFLINLTGAPALSKEEFATWAMQPYWTVSAGLTIPSGDYDKNKLINIGKNRYVFKPQISYGLPLGTGGLLAANANVQLFTDNDDYLGNSELKQKPLYSVDAHFSQNLSRAFWLSADAIYSYGGETQVNGNDQANAQSTLRLGISGSLNLTPVDAIAVSADHTVIRKDHTPAGWTFAINYNHAW